MTPAMTPMMTAAQASTNAHPARDAHQRGDHAVAHLRDVERLEHDERADGGADDAGGGREVRVGDDVAEVVADGAERGAAVEAGPAEEQDQHTQKGERDRVARDRDGLAVAELADPRPEDDRTHERAERTLEVDDRGAGEVEEAVPGEPAATPGPVGDDRVDEAGEDHTEDDVRDELGPVQHGAEDDRERHRGERGLEEEQALDRHRQVVGERAEGPGRVVVGDEPPGGAGEVVAVTEREPEAHGPEHQQRDRHVDEDLGHDGSRVLHSRETDLEHCESSLHEEDENRCKHNPDGVDRIGQRNERVLLLGRSERGHEQQQDRRKRRHQPIRPESHRRLLVEMSSTGPFSGPTATEATAGPVARSLAVRRSLASGDCAYGQRRHAEEERRADSPAGGTAAGEAGARTDPNVVAAFLPAPVDPCERWPPWSGSQRPRPSPSAIAPRALGAARGRAPRRARGGRRDPATGGPASEAGRRASRPRGRGSWATPCPGCPSACATADT